MCRESDFLPLLSPAGAAPGPVVVVLAGAAVLELLAVVALSVLVAVASIPPVVAVGHLLVVAGIWKLQDAWLGILWSGF